MGSDPAQYNHNPAETSRFLWYLPGRAAGTQKGHHGSSGTPLEGLQGHRRADTSVWLWGAFPHHNDWKKTCFHICGCGRSMRGGAVHSNTKPSGFAEICCNVCWNEQQRSVIMEIGAAIRQIPPTIASANLSELRSSAQLPTTIYILFSSFKSSKPSAHTWQYVLVCCRVVEASKNISESGLQLKCLTLYFKKLKNKQRCQNCC